jgi:hypothetical protein
VSDAVPVTVTVLPALTVPPAAGELIEETGGAVSVDAVASPRPDCSVTG